MTRATAPTGYECLADVLDAALMQAASGKGAERHGNGKPFAEQPMMAITEMVGLGFPVGQSAKKGQEAIGMVARGQADAARRELLGAINYLAGAVLALSGTDARRPGRGRWHPNDYTALHERLIGSTGDTQDGALFPSGWTPEIEERA